MTPILPPPYKDPKVDKLIHNPTNTIIVIGTSLKDALQRPRMEPENIILNNLD